MDLKKLTWLEHIERISEEWTCIVEGLEEGRSLVKRRYEGMWCKVGRAKGYKNEMFGNRGVRRLHENGY